MNLMFNLLCKDSFMFEYARKRAAKIDVTLLRYIGAFYDGIGGKDVYYKGDCPKMLRAYRDGVRMKKRGLTN